MKYNFIVYIVCITNIDTFFYYLGRILEKLINGRAKIVFFSWWREYLILNLNNSEEVKDSK